MIRKAVIPAAGFGSRFLPATKAQPKEMLPIIDTPTIQYVIDETVQSGISQILVITGKGKQAIENHFDRSFELETVERSSGNFDHGGNFLYPPERIEWSGRCHPVCPQFCG